MKKEPNGSIEEAGNDTILKGSYVLNISKYLQSPYLKTSILGDTQLQQVVFGLWPVSERMYMLSIAMRLLPLQRGVVHMSQACLWPQISAKNRNASSAVQSRRKFGKF